ncbi:putative RING finger membrane protein C15C4.06c like [Verticillium longisporum]|nr:putative RING finger membrane protein C15C4.06c like [Verticillium longisporum]
MWTWILIVVGALLFIIACVSVTMHLVQRQRRASLRRRVISREVDLEAMGIKRMAVPPAHIREFPLFTYSYQPEVASAPSTPLATRSLRSPRSVRTDQRAISDVMSSSRTRRSSLTSSANTIATNYQPQCHICLEQYEDRVSVIRELPCGHIFHPECIDEFLAINSSLCPICKKNMLPRGYCPKISNAMVRRERAIRRLRSRVVLDDSDDEGGEENPSKSDVALRPSSSPADAAQQPPSTQRTLETTQEEPAEDSVDPQGDGQAHHSTLQTPQPAAAAHHSSRKAKRRNKPRDLRLQAPQPGEQPLEPRQVEGRKSPSALARQRMRTLAGTPLDDPDGRRPVWRKAFTKVFPGFT